MEVPLLFSLIAFEYYQKLEFAYVNSEASQTDELRRRYGVHRGEQAFVIMKEEPSNPEVILKVAICYLFCITIGLIVHPLIQYMKLY